MVEVDGLGKRREGGEGFGGGTGLEGGADLDFRNADARLRMRATSVVALVKR